MRSAEITQIRERKGVGERQACGLTALAQIFRPAPADRIGGSYVDDRIETRLHQGQP